MRGLTTNDGTFRRCLPTMASESLEFDELFDDMTGEVEERFERDELGMVLGDPRLRQRTYEADED